MEFLEDCWYAAAFTSEVTRTPMARVLLGEPVVLYRKESGEPVALGDRCPHRFAPLHQGKLFGDAIRCPYHGLQFDADGKCVHNPAGKGVIPQAAKTPSFPLREVDGVIWLWHGAEEPDEGKIVRFPEFNQLDRWAPVEFMLRIEANHMLVSDNLLDLSHAEFLHPDLAREGFAKRAQLSVSQEGDMVVARNWRPGELISNMSRLSMGGENAPEMIDRSTIVKWHAPANLRFEMSDMPVGKFQPADMPVGRAEGAAGTVQAHLITPETENTCLYFVKVVRDWLIDDEGITSTLHAKTHNAFNTEDRPMIESQQRYMGGQGFEALNPVLLPNDAAAARTRQVLRGKLEVQAAKRSASDRFRRAAVS